VPERIGARLGEAGYDLAVHSDIAREPDLTVATAVSEAVRKTKYVAVIGCGGGSALDPAKLAAAFATNAGSPDEYIRGRQIERPALPLALVPTTAGTGAEVSKNAIVTHSGRKFVISSPLLCPTAAVLDPLLTVSCPATVTAASGMDALAHAIESTISLWATPFTASNGLQAVRTIADWLPRAFVDGGDMHTRRAMLHASFLAGLSINASTLLGHSIAYTIATRTHLPHGVTTAMALPYCIAYNAPATSPQLALLTTEAGIAEGTLARWVAELAKGLQLPTSLREVDLGEDDLPSMVDECLAFYPRPNNPVPLGRERLLHLYRSFLDGDLERTFAIPEG
jgi:alcohol dehydrogenase class IV